MIASFVVTHVEHINKHFFCQFYLIYQVIFSVVEIKIHCPGTTGHGSILHDNTAGEKVAIVVEKFMARRADEKRKLKENPNLSIGDVTTINLTILEVITTFFNA